jgi:glycosyltransferase involved in cell wall biosynthesis
MNPKLSIIVPIYNSETYLSECINSILDQTFQNFELLLINDGSTDNSREICETSAKKDSRVVLINKQNSGVASSRNTGILHAKGDYIGFVDADDTIKPNMYLTLYNEAIHLSADIVICAIKMINHLINEVSTTSVWKDVNCLIAKNTIEKFIIPATLQGKDISLSPCFNKLYKKDIFKNIMFDEKRTHGEDARLNMELLQNINSVAFIDEPLYNYYVRNKNSLTQKFRTDFYEYYLDSKNYGVALSNKYNIPQSALKIENDFVSNILAYLQTIVVSTLPYEQRSEIFVNIIDHKDFNELLSRYSSPSTFYKLLQLACSLKSEKLFTTLVKLKYVIKDN